MSDPERLNARGGAGAALLRAARREAPPASARRRASAAIGAAVAASAAAPAAAAVTGALIVKGAIAIAVLTAIGGAVVATSPRTPAASRPAQTSQVVPAPTPAAAAPRHPTSPALVDTVGPLATPSAPRIEAPSRGAAEPHASSRPAERARPLADEVAALAEAKAALEAGRPDDAMRRLDDFYLAFPQPHLKPEADAMRIEALAARGDRAGARSFLEMFRREHPESPLLESLEGVAGR